MKSEFVKEQAKIRAKAWYRANKKRHKLSCKKYRLANFEKCAAGSAKRTKKWREANHETVKAMARISMKKFNTKRRHFLINSLGGKCACCKETELVFLCVDHRHGGGKKHRDALGSSSAFFRWLHMQLKEKGILAVRRDFRILCWNCNAACHFMGYCPHKRKQK